MSKNIKSKLLMKDKWIRAIYMLMFIVISWIAKIIIGVIALFQFIYSLFVGTPHQALLPFSTNLSQYIYQIVLFLTYVSEDKPFPFTAWPEKEVTQKIPKSVSKK